MALSVFVCFFFNPQTDLIAVTCVTQLQQLWHNKINGIFKKKFVSDLKHIWPWQNVFDVILKTVNVNIIQNKCIKKIVRPIYNLT